MRTLYFTSPEPLLPFAESCLQLTPKVCLFEEHLYLEISSTSRLFGGEEGLVLRAQELADTFLDRYHFSLTDRPEWAQTLCRAGQTYLPPGKSPEFLRQLGVQALLLLGDPLRLAEEKPEREKCTEFLRKVGIHTLAQFLDLPVSAVNRRFGKMGQVLHDWAAGRRTLCLPVFSPQEPLRARVAADDLHSLDSLLFRLRQIFVQFEPRLRGRNAAVKALALLIHFDAHPPVIKKLEFTESTQDPQVLLRVLKEYLQSQNWSSPLTQLEVQVCDVLLHQPAQLSLIDDSESKFHDLAQYVSRLRARLGETQAGFYQPLSSHLAERSFALTWPPPAPASSPALPPRPVFLFDPPRPFRLTQHWRLSFAENLLVEWWAPGGQREYYIARNGQESLWVYHDVSREEWYAHGTFD